MRMCVLCSHCSVSGPCLQVRFVRAYACVFLLSGSRSIDSRVILAIESNLRIMGTWDYSLGNSISVYLCSKYSIESVN